MQKNPFAIDITVITALYRKYKMYVIPAAIILVCILLILFVIVPQVENIFAMQKKEEETRSKISSLKKNVAFVKNINQSKEQSQFFITLKALPVEKDYIGILDAIGTASQKAGVSTSDYSFQVGSLTVKTADNSTKIGLSLTIIGGITETKQFLRELKRSLPLSEVSSTNVNLQSSSMTVAFHYKPLGFSDIDFYKELKPLSKQQQEVFSNLEALSAF